MQSRPPTCSSRFVVALVAALACVAPGCGDDGAGTPDDVSRGVMTNRLAEGDGTTLRYQMQDDWGDTPPLVAQLHLVDVLAERLAEMGEERAAVTVGSAGELRVTVTPDAAERAAAVVAESAEVRLRIRAPSEIENPERARRNELTDFYEEQLPDFAWFPLGGDETVLLYVPEAPLIVELEQLRSAETPDEALTRAKVEDLQRLLLQKVFTGADLANAEAIHRPNDSAVRVTLRPDRQAAFQEYTTHYRGRQMAVLVNDRVIAMPTITEPLDTAAEFRKPVGSFTPAEADLLAAALRRAAYGVRLTRLE